jgi:hypothetical protein
MRCCTYACILSFLCPDKKARGNKRRRPRLAQSSVSHPACGALRIPVHVAVRSRALIDTRSPPLSTHGTPCQGPIRVSNKNKDRRRLLVRSACPGDRMDWIMVRSAQSHPFPPFPWLEFYTSAEHIGTQELAEPPG